MKIFPMRPPGKYLRTSGNLLLWLALKAVFQSITVVALARLLGAEDYGMFVAILGAATLFTPLAGLGLQGVLLRDGARNPEALPQQLGAAISLWMMGSITFSLIANIFALVFLPALPSPWILILFITAEIASASIVELIARAEQARHHALAYGLITTGLVAIKLLAICAFAFTKNFTASSWMCLYAAVSLGYIGGLLLWTRARYSYRLSCAGNLKMIREGLPFSIGALSLRLQAEFNKPVLSHVSREAPGNFNVAQRAIDIAALPLLAMQEALWPRLFSAKDLWPQLLIFGSAMLFLAIGAGCALYLAAPLVPLLLGTGFESTSHLVRMLAWLPTVQVLRSLVNFHTVARHRSDTLLWSYLAGSLSSVGLTLALVTTHGISGPIIACYLSEGIVMAVQMGLPLLKRK